MTIVEKFISRLPELDFIEEKNRSSKYKTFVKDSSLGNKLFVENTGGLRWGRTYRESVSFIEAFDSYKEKLEREDNGDI